ncbi:xyloside xylosyltransferase 1-like [Strongylocentrotus purpuratus]|uniref:Xyloside xylosyltransferase 1 n=1 Tax=Strongylocentrotus purpuratus TaxID=7668 RepID=A0A7M7NWC8_STRPU|nr:xyloside xylosyltransferase 1-like [Strongylocentrotus purpuratus]
MLCFTRRTSDPLPLVRPKSLTKYQHITWITWSLLRPVLVIIGCFWIGYLTAIVGPMLHASQDASTRHRVSRFADYLNLPAKIFDNNKSAPDGILRRSISSPPSDDPGRFRYVLIPLTSVETMSYHKKRFEVCMKSILEKSSIPLFFFFVVDEPSRLYLEETMTMFSRKYRSKVEIQYTFLDQETIAKKLASSVSVVQQIVSGNTQGYYNQSIFFLSVAIHRGILPDFVHQIIMLDTDLKFISDISGLFAHFDKFQGSNVMGIAHDQQPTYRDAFKAFRARNPTTRVGSPAPDGLPGFNSGVVLLDIARMRSSQLYNYYLNPPVAELISRKYLFKGSLGDQDFYSLIGNERENLFYVLPCSWNRHLCRKLYDEYAPVFDSYFNCDGKIHIYHASCNSTMPV